MVAGQQSTGWSSVPGARQQALIKLYTIKSADAGANVYYRLEVPARVASKLKLASLYIEDTSAFGTKVPAELQVRNMATVDAHMYYGGPNHVMRERVNFLLGIKPGHTAPYNLIQHRPGVFWSLDDDYHSLHPLNQAFLWNGYKTPDGKILGAGDSCAITLPDGSEALLWEYGKEYYGQEVFDPVRNRKSIQAMDELLAKVDGVHFTTQRLADIYEPWIKNRFVFPNCIYLPDWDVLPFQTSVREDKDEVRVLWQGGASHFGDLLSIRESMARMTAKYPKLRWILWGGDFPFIHKIIPDGQLYLMPWIAYPGYKPVLSSLDFDFAIAPLIQSPFNDGKSSIKVYEPAALRVPRPTLAAAVPPYADDLVDGETALLYHNTAEFEEKFSALVEDAGLRRKIGTGCKDWLRAERNPETWVPKLLNWFETSRGSGIGLAPEVGAMLSSLVLRGAFSPSSKKAHELMRGA